MHDAGDRFLIQFAQCLSGGMRQGDFVARYGGDEFVVLGQDSSGDPEIGRKAFSERLQQLTTGQFLLGNITLDYAGPSIGVITANGDDGDCEFVLARADAAMYAIKKTRQKASRPELMTSSGAARGQTVRKYPGRRS